MKKAKRSALERQESIAFGYYENLESIIRDLAKIDKMIPSESCRHGCLFENEEERAIVEARQHALLRYIQIICRDHIHFSNKIIADGWTVAQKKK